MQTLQRKRSVDLVTMTCIQEKDVCWHVLKSAMGNRSNFIDRSFKLLHPIWLAIVSTTSQGIDWVPIISAQKQMVWLHIKSGRVHESENLLQSLPQMIDWTLSNHDTHAICDHGQEYTVNCAIRTILILVTHECNNYWRLATISTFPVLSRRYCHLIFGYCQFRDIMM